MKGPFVFASTSFLLAGCLKYKGQLQENDVLPEKFLGT